MSADVSPLMSFGRKRRRERGAACLHAEEEEEAERARMSFSLPPALRHPHREGREKRLRALISTGKGADRKSLSFFISSR